MTYDVTLNNRNFYKKVVQIALPIAIQSIITGSLSLVDNLMVGSLGETALAAVGAGIQLFVIHWMFLFGFTSGSATFMSQFYGQNDMTNIRKTIGFTTIVSLGLGLVFFLMAILIPQYIMALYSTDADVIAKGCDYIRTLAPAFLLLGITQPLYIALRSTQQTQIPLFISLAVFGTNTFLNYVLIFGKFGAPRLETTGAAVATLIARTIEITLVLIVVFGRNNVIKGRLRDFTGFNRELVRRVTKNNVPTTINESAWSIGRSMMMACIGHISVTAYAATQACQTINNLVAFIGFSVGDAALILIGQRIGQGDIDGAKIMGGKFIRLILSLGVVLGVILFIISRPILGLYDFSPEGEFAASRILIVYAVFLPLDLLCALLVSGVLRAGGDTRYAAISELSCEWGIALPLVAVSVFLLHLPVYLVIIVSISESVSKIFFLIHRFRSGKWANNVIEDLK